MCRGCPRGVRQKHFKHELSHFYGKVNEIKISALRSPGHGSKEGGVLIRVSDEINLTAVAVVYVCIVVDVYCLNVLGHFEYRL